MDDITLIHQDLIYIEQALDTLIPFIDAQAIK